MYSASVEDVETVGCLKEMKFTSAAPLMRTRLPEKDFLSDRSPAQSESAMMMMVEEEVSLEECSLFNLMMNGTSMVVLRYRSTLVRATQCTRMVKFEKRDR
jgi:hypothetical protein